MIDPTIELTKIVTTEVVKALLAPYLKGVGERLHKRVEEFFKRFSSILPSLDRIPDRILVPAIHEIAVLENETLQSMWAALLTHAAQPQSENAIRLCFVDILKKMSPDEAATLRRYIDESDTQWFHVVDPKIVPPLDALVSYGLMQRQFFDTAPDENPSYISMPAAFSYVVTALGREFIEVCTLPDHP